MEEEQKQQQEQKEEVAETKPKAKEKKKKPAKKKTTKKKKPASKKKAAAKKEDKGISEPKEAPKKEKVVTLTEKKRKDKKGGGAGIVFVLLLVVILIGGAFYRTQQVSEETEDANQDLREDVSSEVSFLKDSLQNLARQLEDQKKSNEVEMKSYTSPSLAVTFSFPATFGDVTEEVVTQGEGESLQEALTLTFTGNPDIWLTAASNGYTDETGLIYNGSEENLRTLCVDPLAISETGYCDYMNLLGQETVERVLVLGDEAISNIVKSVPANIAIGQYTGLTLNLSLGLPPVTGRNLFAPSSDESTQANLDEFLRNVIKKEALSLITLENIKYYEEIITSLSQE